MPLPLSFTFTVSGLPFHPIDKVPLTAPVFMGVKVTLAVQLAPGATEAPQVLVCVYTLGLAVIC